MINQISHVLRPGGLIEVTEFPFYFTGWDKQPVLPPPGSFHPPWTPLFLSYVHRAVQERGGEADAASHLHEWISNHPAFEDVVYREFWVPCSPWKRGNDPETIFWNEIGTLLRDDIKVSNVCCGLDSLVFIFPVGILEVLAATPTWPRPFGGVRRCYGVQCIRRARGGGNSDSGLDTKRLCPQEALTVLISSDAAVCASCLHFFYVDCSALHPVYCTRSILYDFTMHATCLHVIYLAHHL